MALDMLPQCCGRTPCGCMTEDQFLGHVRTWVYPPFLRNVLCEDGPFDKWVATVLHPLWCLYKGPCGDCQLARDLDPLQTCCLNELFFKLYGLPGMVAARVQRETGL